MTISGENRTIENRTIILELKEDVPNKVVKFPKIETPAVPKMEMRFSPEMYDAVMVFARSENMELDEALRHLISTGLFITKEMSLGNKVIVERRGKLSELTKTPNTRGKQSR